MATVATGSEVVLMTSPAGLILILRVALADWLEGEVESVTLIVAEAVPTALCMGVPVIAPLASLIERPPGSPVAV